jgi:predicted permease
MWRWGRGRARQEDELAAEIQAHLDIEAADHLARGLPPGAARAAARRAFGNVGAVQEQVRDEWGWTMVEQLAQDVRFAIRTMRRSPGFAIAAVLSLAMGIGMNTAIFCLADALVFRPLAIHDPASLVVIRSTSPETPFSGMSHADFKDVRERNRSFDAVIAHRLAVLPFAKTPDAVPQMRMAMKVSRDFFQVLGVEPVLGRGFLTHEAEIPGQSGVAVLSFSFWQTEFNGDPQVVGRTVRVSQTPVTIVGVAPPAFVGMDPIIQPFFYVPASLGEKVGGGVPPSILERRDELGFVVRGRLRNGVNPAQAQADVASIARGLEGEYPDTNRRRGAAVRSEAGFRSEQAPALRPSMVLLLGLSALVLTIVCANVANLFLSRARARSREIAIRLAIGAGQFRLVRQLMAESLMVAVVGGAGGVALAFGAVRYLRSIRIPTDTPMGIAAQIDARVLVFSGMGALLSALAFGLVPAWQAGRADLVSALKRTDVGAPRRRRMVGRQTLVVGQIAVSLVVLVAAGLMLDAFRKMTVLDPGFRTDRILMMELDPNTIGYSDEQTREFYRGLVDRTRALPGVQSAALSRAIPFRPSFTDAIVVPEGFALPPGQTGVRTATNTVDAAYFDTMGVAIVGGRGFTGEDTPDSRRAAVVNETFADTYWPDQAAIGKRFRLGPAEPWTEVVGVARTAKYFNITEVPQAYVYLPLEQHQTSRLTLLVHTTADPLSTAGPVRQVVRSLDGGLPIANTRALRTVYEEGVLGMQLLVVQLVSSMGALGLCLALVGLYAVVTYSVRRRMREFGVRMSIGASRGDILRLVMKEGLVLAGVGVGLGLLLSVPVERALSAALAGIGSLSAWTLVLVPAGLVIVTMAACLGPAWRASQVDPTLVLRLD